MQVCTFNVNSIRAREELLFAWLEKRERRPDILCLQETKVADAVFPAGRFAAAGYRCALLGQRPYNGVAVCSREKPEVEAAGLGVPELDAEKRFLHVRVRNLEVINVYCPRGGPRESERFHYKLRWYGALRHYLEENCDPAAPLVLAGDCNVALEDRDLYDPALLADAVGAMPEERAVLQALLDWGLTDTVRHLHPEEPLFTWWDYQTAAIWRNEGMRLDYILCTAPLLERLEAAEVDLWTRRRRKPTPSDHAPVVATFT